jgi:hypothetical protein
MVKDDNNNIEGNDNIDTHFGGILPAWRVVSESEDDGMKEVTFQVQGVLVDNTLPPFITNQAR